MQAATGMEHIGEHRVGQPDRILGPHERESILS
jgi:hypothetical protein